MHFYTKLQAIEVKEHFLISDETPSIEALLEDEDGNRFVFWGIHPPPPSPTEKPTSKQNDAELMKLGKLIRDAKYRSEEHTSELQSRGHRVCRLLIE